MVFKGFMIITVFSTSIDLWEAERHYSHFTDGASEAYSRLSNLFKVSQGFFD